jgi:hypothetical protein
MVHGAFHRPYLFIYLPVMFAEAETMRQLFPDDYEDYSNRVPLFHMRLTPYRRPADRQTQVSTSMEGTGFDSSLYIRHRSTAPHLVFRGLRIARSQARASFGNS